MTTRHFCKIPVYQVRLDPDRVATGTRQVATAKAKATVGSETNARQEETHGVASG